MKTKLWARVAEGKIIQGPLVLPENFFSKETKNDVAAKSAVESDWLPVFDNSTEVDLSKFAVSADYTIEIFPDRVVKTHKTKEFPLEFIVAYNKHAASLKGDGTEK